MGTSGPASLCTDERCQAAPRSTRASIARARATLRPGRRRLRGGDRRRPRASSGRRPVRELSGHRARDDRHAARRDRRGQDPLPVAWQPLGRGRSRAPVTRQSGSSRRVGFRYAANHHLRAVWGQWMLTSIRISPWTRQAYDAARARGQSHSRATRSVGARWGRILWRCWLDRQTYDPALDRRVAMAA